MKTIHAGFCFTFLYALISTLQSRVGFIEYLPLGQWRSCTRVSFMMCYAVKIGGNRILGSRSGVQNIFNDKCLKNRRKSA